MKNLNYGVIGNCNSAAIISEKGAIVWACLPEFNSPSIFAKLLDDKKGGSFEINVDSSYKITQKYIKNTNILLTKFTSGSNAFEVIDFMPRYKMDLNRYVYPPDIIRNIRHISGEPEISIIYDPKLSYAEHKTINKVHKEYIKSFTENSNYESIYLYSDLPFEKIINSEKIKIKGNHYFLISYNQKLLDMNNEKIYLEFQRTKVYWLDWVNRTINFKKYNDEILRSALVLKLLSFHKTGAILAAVTTSLPEIIGDVRNWDYRYCWVRDASMTITILTNLGHYHAAERFLKFIVDIIPFKDKEIQIMYGIRGERDLIEKELPWLDGYEKSSPVRIGNAAYMQKQNDIYGVLLDVIHKYFDLFKNTLENSEELWTIVRGLTRTVEKNWKDPDMGIWEFRSQKRHFVFSKVLCWVAMDRAVKIANILGKTDYLENWEKLKTEIKTEILEKGWNEELGAFTQAYENTNMDSSNLLMATYNFIKPDDPKYISTVLKIKEVLSKDGLMFRYKNQDDFGEQKSSFTVCSFWMVKSLYLIGRKKDAREMFEKLLTYSNHLGLYSEDIDFETKKLLGNFPQGYSHLALIDAAIVLSDMEINPDDELMHILESN